MAYSDVGKFAYDSSIEFGGISDSQCEYYTGLKLSGQDCLQKLVTHPQDTAQLFKLHMGPTAKHPVQTGLTGRIGQLRSSSAGGRRRGLSLGRDGDRAGY